MGETAPGVSEFGKDRSKFSSDPVHRDGVDGRWYFWDETWADRLGPFATEEVARRRLYEYALELGVG